MMKSDMNPVRRSVSWKEEVEVFRPISRSVTWSTHVEIFRIPAKECTPDVEIYSIPAREHTPDVCDPRLSSSARKLFVRKRKAVANRVNGSRCNLYTTCSCCKTMWRRLCS